MTKPTVSIRELYIHIFKTLYSISKMSLQKSMNFRAFLKFFMIICCFYFHCMPQDMQTTNFKKHAVLHDYFATVKGPHRCWDVNLASLASNLATSPSWVGDIAMMDQEKHLNWDQLQDPNGNWSQVMAAREKGYSLCAVLVRIFSDVTVIHGVNS